MPGRTPNEAAPQPTCKNLVGRHSFVTSSAAALRPRLSRGCMANLPHSYTFTLCKHGWCCQQGADILTPREGTNKHGTTKSRKEHARTRKIRAFITPSFQLPATSGKLS